jgi:cytochrome P450
LPALLPQSEQLARLQEDPSLIPAAVEEFLRRASPPTTSAASPTRDVALGGKPVKEGDKVVMRCASCNRDEEVFGNHYDVDVSRRNNDHVTFGEGGPHLCPGTQLARTEIRNMFEELIPASPTSACPELSPTPAPASPTGSRLCRSGSPWPRTAWDVS